MATLRILLRRSSDETQEFSLDVQRDGCRAFGETARTRTPPVLITATTEYLDDGIAGDDFLGRAGLRRLVEDLAPGDAVVCRDHSRLGRDALEVTIVVREIVKRRGARLFYYASGQEVTFTNAIDAATTFIQGVGAQMELEAIRARTREALRSRVKLGRIAGGKCYGYTNVRRTDGSGRAYTAAIINEPEARVVREIFELFVSGYGLGRIAARLNARGIPSPFAGIRGTGSWSIGCIHPMLRRERYRGVYIHGRTDRVKIGGKRVARRADPSTILRVEVPGWRIVSEETWLATQAALAARRKDYARPGPPAKYPLSGLARCGACGGPISVARTTATGGSSRSPRMPPTIKEARCGGTRPPPLASGVELGNEMLAGHIEGGVAKAGFACRSTSVLTPRTAKTKTGARGGSDSSLPRTHVPAYVCGYHQKRGKAVCRVAIYQAIEDIDRPLLEFVRQVVIPEGRHATFVADVCARVEAALAATSSTEKADLRAELSRLRSEERRYARALSTAPNVPAIARELDKKSAAIDRLKIELRLASYTAETARLALASIPHLVTSRLERFYETVTATPGAARAVNEALFEKSLVFTPTKLPSPPASKRGRPRHLGWSVSLRASQVT